MINNAVEAKYSFDEEFQHRIISCMILEPKFVEDQRYNINPNYFDNPRLAVISRLIVDHYDKYNVIPNKEEIDNYISMYISGNNVKEVESEMLRSTLHKIYHLSYSSASAVADQISPFGRAQRTKRNLIKLATLADDYVGNEPEIMALLSDMQTKLTGRMHDQVESFRSKFKGLPQQMRDRESNSATANLRTGILGLDKATGGIGVGELWFLIGIPGLGKSNGGVNIGKNAILQRKRVLHITNEVKSFQTMKRYAAAITGIPIDDLHKVEYEEHYNKVLGEVMLDEYLDILYVSPYKLTVPMLRSILSRKKNVTGQTYDLLVIDAFYRMGGIDPITGWSGEGAVCKELIGTLDDFQLRCVAMDQPKKDVDRNSPLHYLQMGGEADKFQDADYVISLNQFDEHKPDDIAMFYISKARRAGENTQVPIYYDRQKSLRMTDLSEHNAIMNEKSIADQVNIPTVAQ